MLDGFYYKGPKLYEKGNVNINAYHKDYLQFLIEENIIWLLLLLYCPREFVWKKEVEFSFTLKRLQIQYSALMDSRHNFTKAKRSFEKEKNTKKAKKNLVHGLRYLKWAVQMLEKGEIYDITEGNEYWNEIKNMEVNDWMELEKKLRPYYRQNSEKILELSKPRSLVEEKMKQIEKKMRKQCCYGSDYVIEYIKEFSLEALTNDLSVFVTKDDSRNLFFVSANPIASPKTNIVVKYCVNGILFHKKEEECKVVAYNHPRFLSWERQDCDKIDWLNCVATEMSELVKKVVLKNFNHNSFESLRISGNVVLVRRRVACCFKRFYERKCIEGTH